MNTIRYLTFEVNRTCTPQMVEAHRGKCPISHPERYRFSQSRQPIYDSIIIKFWQWARTKQFRGLVLWHMYNEPALVLPKLTMLMRVMREDDPGQGFQLTTSFDIHPARFEIVKFSDYGNGAELDNRIATASGEGKPYAEMPKRGWCARGLGWEIPIDHYGNWCLCCNDWRCEEAIGNIQTQDWEELFARWNAKRRTIRWQNEEEYKRLPRMCRACLDVNPSLSRRGGI